jgi:crotonobetainyl-CoA:carnitine CoA-transferase CaiB-like acyl-CoA transferase
MTQPTLPALAGLRVIDLTRVLGGPWCTQILGDHGADVLKIEPPQGDETRGWGPPFDDHGDASYFLGTNRNKRGMVLDLRTPEGKETLLGLLAEADVLVENFKPGTLERWGLGYDEVLSARYPRLVHCRISGFGADGPLGGMPGYDAVIQAMCGMFSVNGTAESGPTRMGIPMVDLGTGLYAVIGILMALLERQRSGLGQFLDLALYDVGVALMHPHLPNFLLSGQVPGLTGSAHPNICPYDKFPTATGDIFIGAGNDGAFARLCDELGDPGLAEDARYRTNADRLGNRTALTERLTGLLASMDGKALCQQLLQRGVAAGPVRDTAQVWAEPQTAYRGLKVGLGEYRGVGTPIRLSRSPGGVWREPPRFGGSAGG